MTSAASTTDSTDARQDQATEAAEPQQPGWPLRLRRFGYAAQPRTGVRDRLVPPFPGAGTGSTAAAGGTPPGGPRRWSAPSVPADRVAPLNRLLGWAGPLLVALVAGALRFWNLGHPKKVIFDETYYAKDAWALLHRGYEINWPKDYNDEVIRYGSDVPLGHDAAYVVHPPIGKWVIALGEWMHGLTPFGWRFMTALLGTLSVLMLCRIGRRLFRSTFLGCLAGGLLAVDGLHFVMSRTALLDLVLMFFVLAAFGCLVVDRDRARARLLARLPVYEDGADGAVRPDAEVAETARLGLRPWRIAAGVCLGLAFATKWNGLYILAAFALMSVLWDVGARRVAGAGRPYAAVLKRDVLPAFVSTVPVAIGTYVASWTGWITTGNGYFRNWAATEGKGGSWTFLPDWLRSLWHYEYEVYQFHIGLTSGHTYDSNPWSWLVLGRPVSYYYESPTPGKDGCPTDAVDKCAAEVLALGTPLLWWAACFAVAYVLWRWLFRRDWRAGAILCGIAAGYLPWFMYQERTIFYFYAVVFVPFLCLALAMMIGAILGPPGSSERRRIVGAVSAGVLVLLIVWNFIYFWPIYTGTPIPVDSWQARMWLDTWV